MIVLGCGDGSKDLGEQMAVIQKGCSGASA